MYYYYYWIAEQAKREHLVDDGLAFIKRLQTDRIVHVVTDGGPNPNSGPGGRGAIVRQNGEYFTTNEHEIRATNNTMELLATVQALRLPSEGFYACVSTDLSYIKKGITESIHNWKRNGWKMASPNMYRGSSPGEHSQ
jgi:ribonuclease HI